MFLESVLTVVCILHTYLNALYLFDTTYLTRGLFNSDGSDYLNGIILSLGLNKVRVRMKNFQEIF